MSLANKTVFILVAITITALLAHSSLQKWVLQPRFTRLEQLNAARDAQRVKETLEREIRELNRICLDWSAWDDSCEFLETRSEKYVRSNLTPETFVNLKLDLLEMYDAQGKRILREVRDSASGESLTIPGLPSAGFSPVSPLVHHQSPESSTTGLIQVGSQWMMVASNPIITSQKLGPVRGTLIHGRLITKTTEQRLHEQTDIDLELLTIAPGDVAVDGVSAPGRMDPIRITPSDESMAARAVLRDVEGKPVAILQTHTPRILTKTARMASAAVPLAMLTILAAAMWAIRRFVVRRITQFTDYVVSLRDHAAPSEKPDLKAKDEMGLLAREFDALIDQVREHENRLNSHNRELEEMNRALEAARQVAERANDAKSQFLANMSHELRTPLHAILSFAAFGIKKVQDADREKLQEYFQLIQQSGKTQLALVNDLLDLAKLEMGRMAFSFTYADLHQLVLTVAGEFREALSQRKIRLVTPPPTISPWIRADSERIAQVVRNLLSNAAKFSPEGGIIEITVGRREEDLLLTVADQGVGIPEGELEAIFDRFIQSSKTRTGAGGTGLGLAICREIVSSHKGRIWAENRPHGGAKFLVQLPIDVTQSVTADPVKEPALAAVHGND